MYFGTTYVRRKHKGTWKFPSSSSSFTCVGNLAPTGNINGQVAFLCVWGEMIWDKLKKALGMRDCPFHAKNSTLIHPFSLQEYCDMELFPGRHLWKVNSKRFNLWQIFFCSIHTLSWRFLPPKVTASHSTGHKRVRRNKQKAEAINGV